MALFVHNQVVTNAGHLTCPRSHKGVASDRLIMNIKQLTCECLTGSRTVLVVSCWVALPLEPGVRGVACMIWGWSRQGSLEVLASLKLLLSGLSKVQSLLSNAKMLWGVEKIGLDKLLELAKGCGKDWVRLKPKSNPKPTPKHPNTSPEHNPTPKPDEHKIMNHANLSMIKDSQYLHM